MVIDQEVIDEMNVKLEESGVLEPIEKKGLMGYIEETLVAAPDGDASSGNSNLGEMQESLNQAKEIMNIVRQVTSYKAVAALAGVFLILMVALFFVTGRSFPATLSQTGSMVLLTGVIFGVPTVLCKAAPSVVTGILGKELGVDPLVMLICLYAGVKLLGFAGLLLSPLMAMLLTQVMKAAR